MAASDEVAGLFLDAIRRRDFDALSGCLHPMVQLRALRPGDAVVRMGASAVTERLAGWFGGWDEAETLRADAWEVAGRLAIAYRIRVRSASGTREVEQHLYCDMTGQQITAIDLLCSGFRPVPQPPPSPEPWRSGR
jgi:hypothetical protein